ncbi:hypothetical protein ES695_20605 [Candidatus Atribacteria bacterium 1244-E10-H5-B2]|nr:MAG: hypothetical protein ES695_20605 [Candidatus Atribacteria bacterium 1244-E10-H5-B2]
MTHTLHREGSDESLKDDYLLLITPAMKFNDKGAAEKIKKLIDVVFDVGPTNYGCYEKGRSILAGLDDAQSIKDVTKDNSRIRCVFDSKEKFKEVIRRIVKADLGLSVALTGLQSSIKEVLDELNIDAHSINIAMGTYGKTGILPDENFRMLTTMCGHGMISPNLVKDVIVKIKRKRISVKEAAIILSKPCVCGVFNQERAARLLEKFIPLYTIQDKVKFTDLIFRKEGGG